MGEMGEMGDMDDFKNAIQMLEDLVEEVCADMGSDDEMDGMDGMDGMEEGEDMTMETADGAGRRMKGHGDNDMEGDHDHDKMMDKDGDHHFLEKDHANWLCENAKMLLKEAKEYNEADDDGKADKASSWGRDIEESVRTLLMGATSTTMGATALAAVVSLLSF